MIRGFYVTTLVCISFITAGCGGSAMSKTEYGKVYSEAYSKGHKEGFEKGMNAGGYMGAYIDPYNPLPYGMQSKLSMAVQAGKLDEVKRLIEEDDADVNEIDGQGYSPLQYAARFGYEKMARYLIEKGADINHHSSDGYTPLKEAVMSNKPHLVSILVDAGSDVDLVDNTGISLLSSAVQNGNKQTVKLLLSKGADVNMRNNVGWAPLISAASYGFTDIVELLLSKGADPEDVDSVSGRTAIFYAVSAQNAHMVKVFIKAKANVNAIDATGNTPLIQAVLLGRRDISAMLIEGGANLEAEAHGPVLGNYVDPFAGLYGGQGYLGQVPAPVGGDLEGKKPLHLAAERGYRDIVQLLLKEGAAEGAKGPDGVTAKALAERNGHRSVVEILSKPQSPRKKKK